MKIKLIERRKPGTKTGPGKFYASPVNVGKKNLRDIAHDIAGRSREFNKQVQIYLISS